MNTAMERINSIKNILFDLHFFKKIDGSVE